MGWEGTWTFSGHLFLAELRDLMDLGTPVRPKTGTEGESGKVQQAPQGTGTAEAPLQAHEEDGERRKGDSRTL